MKDEKIFSREKGKRNERRRKREERKREMQVPYNIPTATEQPGEPGAPVKT